MKIIFRADASLKIGTGHIMRCLTLADELKNRGAEVGFICRDLPGNLADFIRSKSYDIYLLSATDDSFDENKSKYNEWLGVSTKTDAVETHGVLLNFEPVDWLVVDHYALDENWENIQRDVTDNILVIDDLADRPHDCDLLLDQNFYAEIDGRYTDLVPKYCQQLLGPKYTLLRKEFRDVRSQIKKRQGEVRKIFVFFGGVDATNMTSKIIDVVVRAGLDTINFDVVIGSTNPHRVYIEKLCEKVKNITLHIQVNNMAQLMSEADLCIGSGGTVTWERCCLGLPAMAFSVAENQQLLLQDSAKAGLVYVADVETPSSDEIEFHLKALLQNSHLREHISQIGLNTVDGKGVLRLANMLIKPELELRLAVLSDMEKIYTWRNDVSVRQYSHNPAEIDYTKHQLWYEKIVDDCDRPVLIASIAGKDLGVVRFDINDYQAEVSIYLIASMQGNGYGSALLSAGEKWLIQYRKNIKNIVAEILPENIASQKLFESSGYVPNTIRYQKSIASCL